jgi:hypothetical protein
LGMNRLIPIMITLILLIGASALLTIPTTTVPAQADWQDQRYWAKGQYWSYSERYQNGYNEGVQDAKNNSPESCGLDYHTQVYCDGYHAGYISINNGNQQQQGQTQGQTQGQNSNSQSNPSIKIIINNNNTNNGATSSNSTAGSTGGTSGGGNQP